MYRGESTVGLRLLAVVAVATERKKRGKLQEDMEENPQGSAKQGATSWRGMRMEENAAALHTMSNAIQALGRGFDVNFDTRLLYCKGVAGTRIVEIDEEHRKDVLVCDGMTVADVPRDVSCFQESSRRESTGICSFDQVDVLLVSCVTRCWLPGDWSIVISSLFANGSDKEHWWLLAAAGVIFEHFHETGDQASLVTSDVVLLRFLTQLKSGRHQLNAPFKAVMKESLKPDAIFSSMFSHTCLLPCLQMVEYFNKKALLSGAVPLGSFNSAFSFTGSKHIDAAATKSLAVDGVFLPLFKVELMRNPLTLTEDVKRGIPVSWEPSSLSSFIENFGTHIITSVTIGGKDVIYVKQHQSSPLSTMELKKYVQDIGDQRFSVIESHASSGPMKFKDKASAAGVDPFLFNSQGIHPQLPSAPYLSGKEARISNPLFRLTRDVTVIFRRRGGDDLIQNHTLWAKTVHSAPDVIGMTFVPITSLLDGIPGKDHLTRAIGLYLEYKPPIEELRYFLEFQIPRVWAPIQDNRPGLQRKVPVCPSLQFSMMGQKLYVSQDQVSVGRKPVTGLRLCLEGMKQNRFCIHVQHLASLPKVLLPYWDTHVAIGAPKWQGPEEQDSRWFEPVKWKSFSHVSTAPIEYNDNFIGDLSGVYIVTGAQLGVWDFGARNVLYMKLLYSKVPGCTIRRSLWDHSPTGSGNKSKTQVTVNSVNGDDNYSSGSKDTLGKLAKFIDTLEMSKGPQDMPGHWLVTGGKLGPNERRADRKDCWMFENDHGSILKGACYQPVGLAADTGGPNNEQM
ncbi:hypothetical protein ACLOJK_012192 [Asimina triloba]